MPLPTIPSGNVASALGGAYEVANSCRFNKADSARMVKTPSGSGNVDRWTFSCWIKRGKISDATHTIFCGLDGSDTHCVRFNSNDKLDCHHYDGAYQSRLETDRVFRDCSAWYNIIYVYDSGNGTANDRQKIYINGVEETLFANRVNADSGEDGIVSVASKPLYVGDKGDGGEYFDGYMAEVCLVDGQALTPTSFGEFDEDSPRIWKPIDVSGLTFGTNGFYLDFEDSSNLGNDANGGTDLTEANLAATDQSIDTPTNNFCVLNPLTKGSYITLSEGNLLSTGNSSTDQGSVYGTLSANSGKWYAEAKITVGGTASYPLVCISHINDQQYGSCTNGGNDDPGRYNTASGCYRANGDKRSNNVTSSSWGNSFDDDDIISVAIDCDNGATYVAKNGTWENSGDPTSGASKTGALVTWTPANEDMSTFSDSQYNSSSSNWNFGSPAFTISSGNADGNGYGNFEYAVPANYYSLCTKNLAEFG